MKYYSLLLLKGFDVRNEGLSWIIRKLIELKVSLDKHCFPNFISTSNIEFLIKISHKEVELNQYKLILKGLKLRQHRINKIQKEVFNKVLNTADDNITYITKFNRKSIRVRTQICSDPNLQNSTEKRKRNKTIIKNKIADSTIDSKELNKIKEQAKIINKENHDRLKEIEKENSKKQKKLKNIFTSNFSDQNDFFNNENLLISVAVNNLKRKMLTFANNDGVFEIDLTNDMRLAQYFEVNMKSQEYFKEVIRIKQYIEVLEKELNVLKQNKIETFRKKYEIMVRNNNGIKLIELDLVYASLFGINL